MSLLGNMGKGVAVSAGAEADSNSVPVPTPQPCSSCQSAVFWEDPYGGRHCGLCQPPPVRSMVRRLWMVVTGDGGQLEWEQTGDSARAARVRGGGWRRRNPAVDEAGGFIWERLADPRSIDELAAAGR